ncbi:hypothetical protein [Pseudomonas sp. BE134]|uniref:hypothetical protein n=1 Tax=Pseudomonas sp. BE134 TaxID=2817843 RepID=UPI00285F8B98|nr:hypothetical protein [Pseudomonas sp. BE134]MDR6927115.1 putative C2H2 Zn-finger protein [Pseudomonas sp. BE134]
MSAVQTALAAIDKPTDRRLRCPSCGKQFRPSRSNQRFCDPKCKQKVADAKRKVDQDSKSLKIPFCQALGRAVLSAGTTEVFFGMTYSELEDLLAITRLTQSRKGYDLSHIAPVAGASSVGLFKAENLVSLPASFNRSHGNAHFGYGVSRARKLLNPANNVPKSTTRARATKLAIDSIGRDMVLKLIKDHKLVPSQKTQLVDWITNNYQSMNPVHCLALPVILGLDSNLTGKQLNIIKVSMQGKRPKGGMTMYGGGYEPPEDRFALCSELERCSKYRPELGPYAHALAGALMTQVEFDTNLFSSEHTDLICRVLSGMDVANLTHELELMISGNTVHGWFVGRGASEVHHLGDCASYTLMSGQTPRPIRLVSLAAYKSRFPAPAVVREPVVLEVSNFESFNAIVPGAVVVPIQITHRDPYDNYSTPF